MRAIDLSTNLDEIGIGFSCKRLPEETLASYRRRLYAYSVNPPDATVRGYVRTTSIQLGEFDTLIGLIDLRLDSEGNPLAIDPVIEVTAGRIKFWSDYSAELLDFECWFNDRTNGYFIRDIKAGIDASAFFSISRYEADSDYLMSCNLRVGNNLLIEAEAFNGGRAHKLKQSNIREIWFNDAFTFVTEKTTYDDLTELGDYFVDKINGVIWTYNPSTSSLTYTYRQYPFRLYWQPVRAIELTDVDYDRWLYESPDYERPTEYGLDIISQVEALSPQHWK